MIAGGAIGAVHFIHGAYLQDWLLEATDYSWRLDPAIGGASSAMGDIGSHWCDLVQHVSGQRIVEVLAELTTVIDTRFKPPVSTQALAKATTGTREAVKVSSEDLGTVLVRFDNGARGTFSVGQVCAGHKNDLWFEVSGRASGVAQEHQNSCGSAEEMRRQRFSRIRRCSVRWRAYAHLPGGHQEAWADAFCNVMRDVYGAIVARANGRASDGTRPPAFATFHDGYDANCVVDAVLESHGRGGVWTKVAR